MGCTLWPLPGQHVLTHNGCPCGVLSCQAAALATVPEVEQEQSAAAFEARWSAYMQEATKLNLVLGAHAADNKPIHHRQVAYG